jgi:O-methyltransferase involved in polyketide biosynthesis
MTGNSLFSRLSEFRTGRPAIIIIEGVFIYLTEEAISQLIRVLRELFPKHLLICDLQTYRFFRQFNLKFQEVLKGFGAALCITSDTPENLFLSYGYRIQERVSIVDRTMHYARLTVRQLLIKLVMNTILRDLKDGYSIYCFKYGSREGTGNGEMETDLFSESA